MAANPANPQTWNMYAYAGDNPTSLNDPSGLYPWMAAGNCLYDTVTVGVNGESQGTYTYFNGCLLTGDGDRLGRK